jgi:hypothetical protein
MQQHFASLGWPGAPAKWRRTFPNRLRPLRMTLQRQQRSRRKGVTPRRRFTKNRRRFVSAASGLSEVRTPLHLRPGLPGHPSTSETSPLPLPRSPHGPSTSGPLTVNRPPASHPIKALSAPRRRADAELDETIEATVADSADNPEIALQKKSRSELVRAALMKLSPDHREIVDLVYYHEKSVEA